MFCADDILGEYVEASSIINDDMPSAFITTHIELPMAQELDEEGGHVTYMAIEQVKDGVAMLPLAQELPTLIDEEGGQSLDSDSVEFLRTEMGPPPVYAPRVKRERSPDQEEVIEGGAAANVVGGSAQARGGNTNEEAAPPPPRAAQTEEPSKKKQKKVKKKSDGAVVPQGTQAKYWCFTAHPQDGKTAEEWGEMIFNGIKMRCKKVAMQIERCPETGKRHIQGCLEGNNKLRWTEFKLHKSIHWEQCKGTWSDNFSYCTKEDTRDGRNWLKGCMIAQEIKILKEEQLTEWQTDLLSIMDTEADDRTVYWIWSTHGGVGKSSFAKYCAVTRPGVMVANGKATDILAQVVTYKDTTGVFPSIIIMNLPRCTEGHVSYMALEQMKDGLAMSSKYEGGQIIMNPAHVFVFANTPPDMTKMSEDRFKIICLDDMDMD